MTPSLAEQTPSRSIEPREIVPRELAPAQQQILTLVDRMWDYTHKTLTMGALKSQGHTQEMIEAVTNLYHIVYNGSSTVRKNLKTTLEKVANLTVPFGTEVYANSIAIVKALIIAGIQFNKNTTYDNIKQQLKIN
jgi:hypothetical protein